MHPKQNREDHTMIHNEHPTMIQIARDIMAATIAPFPHAMKWDINPRWHHTDMAFCAVIRCAENQVFVIRGEHESAHGFFVSNRARTLIDSEMNGMSPHAAQAIYGADQVAFKESGTFCTGERAAHQTHPPKGSEVEGRIRAAFANAGFAISPDSTPGEGFRIDI